MGHHRDLRRHARRVADDEQLAADGDCPRPAGRLRVAAAETVERVSHGADTAARDLDVLGELLERLERQPFTSPRLVALQGHLESGGVSASRAIRALHRLVELHDWQHNLFFLIFSLPFMWGTHVSWSIEEWRRAHGRHLRLWIDAVGELEAFSSLSVYRFEHPDDPFPDIVEPPGAGRTGIFDGRGLGHPLLPAARAVRNDVACVAPTQCWS
jgi:hypothetical protein